MSPHNSHPSRVAPGGARRRSAGAGVYHAIPAPPPGAAATEYERLSDAARDRVAEALLAVRVRDRLLARLKLDALPIRVTALGRTVTLAGELQRRSARVRAELAALSVGGVKKVINQLTFAPGATDLEAPSSTPQVDGPSTANALLEARIKIRLLTRLGLEAFHIQVEAVNGVIILSGTVTGELHLDQALHVTRATAGVREIHDLIEIAPAAPEKSGH